MCPSSLSQVVLGSKSDKFAIINDLDFTPAVLAQLAVESFFPHIVMERKSGDQLFKLVSLNNQLERTVFDRILPYIMERGYIIYDSFLETPMHVAKALLS